MIKHLFANNPMGSKIFIALLLLLILPFLFFAGYIYYLKIMTIISDFEKQMDITLNKCANLINAELLLSVEKSTNAISNQYILNGLRQDYTADTAKFMNFANYINIIFDGVNPENSTDNETLKIYLKNKSLHQSKYIDFIENIDNVSEASDAANSIISEIKWSGQVVTGKYNNKKYIVYYRSISDVTDNIGVLRVMIPFEKMEYFMKNTVALSGEIFAYFDSEGTQITTVGGNNDKEKIGIYKSQKLLNGHLLTVYMPKGIVDKVYFDAFIYIGTGLLFIIFIALVSGYSISNSITFRLHGFVEQLRSRKTDSINMADINRSDEVSIIELKFKELVDDIEKMHSESNYLRARIDLAEFELLQAKINPHLLYNSLSSLRWEAQRNGEENICKLIDILSKYYRGIFSQNENVITVKDEIRILEDYIEIAKLSYNMNYNVKIEIESEVDDCYMYKMLLQPLVENAILHGIQGQEDGIICIKAYLQDTVIVFKIIDNGYGIAPEKLKELITESKSEKHYGIKNIIERIKLFYGDKYGVEIESTLNKGTSITVKIPCECKDVLLNRLGNKRVC